MKLLTPRSMCDPNWTLPVSRPTPNDCSTSAGQQGCEIRFF